MNGPEQMQRQETDRTGVRKYRDSLTIVITQDVSQLRRDSPQQLPVALASGNDVVDIAVTWCEFFSLR